MQSSFLLSLYDSVLYSVLCEWLYCEDLCCLDSAFCITHFRSKFLTILSKCSIVNTNDYLSNEYSEWMFMRHLTLKKILIERPSAKVTAVLDQHLSFVECNDIDCLDKVLTSSLIVDALKISLDSYFSPYLKNIGHLVSHVEFVWTLNEDFIVLLASLCPSLRSVKCYSYEGNGDAILPLVDGFLLDSILRCNLTYLLTRESCVQTYGCDLVRVPVMDETAVCLGEGKYYHVTGVYYQDSLTTDDMTLLTKVLPTVKTLCLSDSQLASLAASKCRNLTSLEVDSRLCFWESEICALIKSSPLLKHLSLSTDDEDQPHDGNAVLTMAARCAQLTSCFLQNVSVQSGIVSQLFQQCSLTEFRHFSSLILEPRCILDFLANIDTLDLFDLDSFRVEKKGRRNNKLVMHWDISVKLLSAILCKNPGAIIDVTLSIFEMLDDIVNCVVKHCSQLASIAIVNGSNTTYEYLNALVDCTTLTSISLSGVAPLESVYLKLFANKVNLRSLCLLECRNYTGELLSLIAETCPDLRKLELTHNTMIKSSHIIEVLTRCKQLHTLDLNRCLLVDKDILPHIQSPPMRKVALKFCGMSVSCLTMFSEVPTLDILIR